MRKPLKKLPPTIKSTGFYSRAAPSSRPVSMAASVAASLSWLSAMTRQRLRRKRHRICSWGDARFSRLANCCFCLAWFTPQLLVDSEPPSMRLWPSPRPGCARREENRVRVMRAQQSERRPHPNGARPVARRLSPAASPPSKRPLPASC